MMTHREPEVLSDDVLDAANGGQSRPAIELNFAAGGYSDGCNQCVCTEAAGDAESTNPGLPSNWVARRKQP